MIIKIGDKVLLKDLKRRSKFDPKYLPRLYEVIEVKTKGVVVKGRTGKEYKRHKDDVKRSGLTEGEEGIRMYTEQESIEDEDLMTQDIEAEVREEEVEVNREEEEEQYEEHEEEHPPRRSTRDRRAPRALDDYEL